MSATGLWKNNTQVLTHTLGTIKEKQQSQKPLVLFCFQGTEVKKNLYQKKKKSQLQMHFETVSSCRCF